MNNLLAKISSLLKKVAKPVLAQLPFFVFTFLMWASSCWMEIRDMINEGAWRSTTNANILVYLGLAFFYSYCVTLIVHMTKSRVVKIACYMLSLLVFFVLWVLRKVFFTNITPDIMLLAVETNADEAGEFLQTYIFSHGAIVAMVMTLVLTAVIIVVERFYSRIRTAVANSRVLAVIVAVIVFCSLFSIRSMVSLLSCRTMPDIEKHFTSYGTKGMDNLSQIVYSIHSLNISSTEALGFLDISEKEAKSGDAVTTAADSLNLVVIIGESYNKSHAGIYGYPLNTTPRLKSELEKGNLMVFTDVISPYNTTSKTLKNVFSTNVMQHGEHWQDFPLAMAVFHRAGYNVFWWDNQLGRKGKRSIFDFSLNSILFHPRLLFCYSMRNTESLPYDGDLVDDFLKEVKSGKKSAHQLVVFHLLGQHVIARERYPILDKQWTHFTPDSVVNNAPYIDDNARKDIAHYDNATFYNDYTVGRIIDMFAGTNTVVIYFSDHGEEVYDYRYGIGRNHSENKDANNLHCLNDVPFVVWCSPSYQATHPQEVERIRQAVDRPFMNTDLVQMLFDLGGITTKHRNDSYNPISSDFKPYRRMVYDSIDYDAVVHASIGLKKGH